MEKTIEIIILSGFLGSGKTTLLKDLLEQEKQNGRQAAVLMNEIGKVSVDSEIVGEDTPITEVLDGCACCTGKDQLEYSLLVLFKDVQPDVIYIESSGIAHPIEILDACLNPLIADKVSVRAIVTVLDSVGWLHRHSKSLPIQKLYEEQVEHADLVLVNKVDLLEGNQLQTVLADMQRLNAEAAVKVGTFAQLAVDEIPHGRRTTAVKHEPLHVHDHLHVSAMVYTFEHFVSKVRFEQWLQALPTTIYRLKGFLGFIEEPETMSLFQYAYRYPMYYQRKIFYKSNLVIIGENLDKAVLKEQLQALEELDAPIIKKVESTEK